MYEEIMDHLRGRMLFADELAPSILCSIGAHIGNLNQQDEPYVFDKFGVPERISQSTIIVSPAGFSKSYLMFHFMDKRFGILPPKGLPSVFRGKITEAGFVGTLSKDGDPIWGDAVLYANGFLCFNEMSSILMEARTREDQLLQNAVQEALTEGQVSKRLAYGEVTHGTNITIIGGIQPSNFDFSGGLGRRFVYDTKAWSEEDVIALKKSRRDKSRKCINKDEIRRIRNHIEDLMRDFSVSEVRISEPLMDRIEEDSDTHLMMARLERLLTGKEILTQGMEDIVKVKNSLENRNLIDSFLEQYDIISRGSDLTLMLTVIDDEEYSLEDLWAKFKRFSYTYQRFYNLLDLSVKLKLIKYYKGKRQVPGSNLMTDVTFYKRRYR